MGCGQQVRENCGEEEDEHKEERMEGGGGSEEGSTAGQAGTAICKRGRGPRERRGRGLHKWGKMGGLPKTRERNILPDRKRREGEASYSEWFVIIEKSVLCIVLISGVAALLVCLLIKAAVSS